MIISILFSFLVLCALCVGCDYIVAPILTRCQARVTRTDMAMLLCLVIPVGAFLARGVVGLLDISSFAIVGPTYVYLTGKTSAPISLKGLLIQIWENGKQGAKRIFGIK